MPNPACDTRLVGMDEVTWATDGSVAPPPPSSLLTQADVWYWHDRPSFTFICVP